MEKIPFPYIVLNTGTFIHSIPASESVAIFDDFVGGAQKGSSAEKTFMDRFKDVLFSFWVLLERSGCIINRLQAVKLEIAIFGKLPAFRQPFLKGD